MNKKHLVLATAFVVAVVAGTAIAAPPSPGQKLVPLDTVTWTCPPMVSPPITTIQTTGGSPADWSLDSGQGWLDHGAITQGTTEQIFECYYGNDRADPAARPMFWIHKALPANFQNCTLVGPKRTSMTCQTQVVPKFRAAP